MSSDDYILGQRDRWHNYGCGMCGHKPMTAKELSEHTLTCWKPKVPLTPAGKIEIIMELLKDTDEDGSPTEPLMTKEEIMEILK